MSRYFNFQIKAFVKMKVVDIVQGNATLRKNEIKRRKEDIKNVVNSYGKMKSDYEAVVSIQKSPDKSKLIRAENDARNSKIAFENLEKTTLTMVQKFEREKVDTTMVFYNANNIKKLMMENLINSEMQMHAEMLRNLGEMYAAMKKIDVMKSFSVF